MRSAKGPSKRWRALQKQRQAMASSAVASVPRVGGTEYVGHFSSDRLSFDDCLSFDVS